MWSYDPSIGRFDADGILKALIVCCRLIVLFVTGEYVVKPEDMLRIIQPHRVSSRLAFGDEALNLLEETLKDGAGMNPPSSRLGRRLFGIRSLRPISL